MSQSLRTWSGKGLFALLDQGLISGSNFIIAIILARVLAPQHYGAYALAFELFLLLAVLYGALVLEPMSVFGPSVYRDHLEDYLGILLRLHYVISLAIVVAVFAGAWVLRAIRPESSLFHPLIGVGVATPCVLLFWLARRGFYVKLLPQGAVVGACIYCAVVLGALLVVHRLRLLSPLLAFLLMGTGAAITGPLMMSWLRPAQNAGSNPLGPADVIRLHWGYGRWAVATAVASWLSAAIYYPLLGGFHTLVGAGRMKALMNLTSPVAQAFVAVSLLSLPYTARTHHRDDQAVGQRLVWYLTALYAGGSCAYWVVLIFLRHPVFHYLYGGKYTQVMGLLPWVALGSVLRISATAQAVALKAMQSPALVCAAYSASSILALLAGVPAIYLFGLQGAVFTFVLSSATASAAAFAMVRHRSKQSGWSRVLAQRDLVPAPEASSFVQQ